MIIDKEKKVLFKKYLISKFPLTKVFFLNEHFICAGEGPLIYCWKFDNEKLDFRNVFSFLENGKEKAILTVMLFIGWFYALRMRDQNDTYIFRDMAMLSMATG